MSNPAGRKIPMSPRVKDQALAWTKSLKVGELVYFEAYLQELGFLKPTGSTVADDL